MQPAGKNFYLYRMRIYVDIAHPAHAHALRFFIVEMEARGHEILVSARDKDITHNLLTAWGIPFINRGKGHLVDGRPGIVISPSGETASGRVDKTRGFLIWWSGIVSLSGKLIYLLRVIIRLLPVVRKFRPDLVISYSSYHAALTGRLLGRPVITFEDTENVPLLHLVNRFLSFRMVTPVCFERDFGRKHIRFDGYKELASLYPARFKPLALPGDFKVPYIVMRLVSWSAWHDRGHKGISDRMKIAVARRLSAYAKVVISSETPLEEPLKKYEMNIDSRLGHSVLAGARLFFGESASMAAEAAVLGVPAVYIDNTGRGYTRDLEREHGLLFNFGEDDAAVLLALDKAVELLQNPDLQKDWQQKRTRMLVGKRDVTAMMVEMAENLTAGDKR